MKKLKFESLARQLVGQRLRRAFYFGGVLFEGDLPPDVLPWNEDNRFDSVSAGVELCMQGGDSYWITYGSEFFHYGVSLQATSKREELLDRPLLSEETTDCPRWANLVGSTVRKAVVQWEKVHATNGSWEVGYPQTLKLTFSKNRKVYFSALEVYEDGSPWYSADHLTVFFSDEEAAEFEIGTLADAG